MHESATEKLGYNLLYRIGKYYNERKEKKKRGKKSQSNVTIRKNIYSKLNILMMNNS